MRSGELQRSNYLVGQVGGAVAVLVDLEVRQRTAHRLIPDFPLPVARNVWLPRTKLDIGEATSSEKTRPIPMSPWLVTQFSI